MAKAKCTSCNGTGNAYNGFGDAPYKQCETCSGTGFIGTEDEAPFAFTDNEAPFAFTDNERNRIAEILRQVQHNSYYIPTAIAVIEAIIAEEVDNVS